jgi:protein-tyrosine phosphatase
MTTTIVQYRTKPERAEENQQLINAVFSELELRQPDGFTYKVFRLEDDVSFIHVMIEHDPGGPDLVQDLSTFKAFVANIVDRCESPPVETKALVVGGYR